MRRGKAEAMQVAPVSDEPEVTSDEAQLLATRSGVPVYISADRATAARALLRNHPAVDVLICDDGLQHYALERDLEICVIDGVRGFGNGRLLPAGGLREPLPRLGQVDALLINGEAETMPLRLGSVMQQVATYPMALGNESLVRVCDGKMLSIKQGLAEFSSKDIFAIAGTGNPARFFAHLVRLGFALAGSRAFADHHHFVASELSPCDAEIILMTEKDAVKCRVFADDRMWFMRVDALLPDAFGEFVLKRLSDLKK
jgi:tetraacyldisaccharide 4'-kinase